MKQTHLITGIPRSGTSLLISLISVQKKGVCLSEPTWLKEIRKASPSCGPFAKNLSDKLTAIRNDIKRNIPIPIEMDQRGVSLPTNYFNRKPGSIKNKSTKLVQFPQKMATKPIYIKSNTQLTACLETLLETGFNTVTALIRDPIATLLSWRSLEIPVSHGKLGIGLKYATETRQLQFIDQLLDKQIFIIDWFFKKFYDNQNRIRIIRYEDLVANPGKIMTSLGICDKPTLPNLSIKNKNTSRHYNLSDTGIILDALRKNGTYWKFFYPEHTQ